MRDDTKVPERPVLLADWVAFIMRTYKSIRALVCVMALTTLGCDVQTFIAGSFPDRPLDARAARADISNGELRYFSVGPRDELSQFESAFEKLAENRYRICIQAIDDRRATVSELKGVYAYNSVMIVEIQRRYGIGILNELWNEAAVQTTQSTDPRPSGLGY